jgi:hypothetical protein
VSGDVKRLKVLLPELLPAPVPPPAVSARDRVAARALTFLQRFRGLGTAAGAAVLSLQCSGYGVVDPLPPPAQQCSALPDPFTKIVANGHASGDANGGINVVLELFTGYYPTYKGFRVEAVRVDGGTFVSTADVGGGSGTGESHFLIDIAPDATASAVTVEVDLGCNGAAATKRYHLSFQRPLSTTSVVMVDPLD